MKMKHHPRKNKFSLSLAVIFTALLFTPNFLGLSLKIDHSYSLKDAMSQSEQIVFSNLNSNFLGIKEFGQVEIISKSPWHEISWMVIGIIITIAIMGPYFGLLGIRFLKDQPLNKQSIINKLSRDCTKNQIMFFLAWIAHILIAKYIEHPDNWTLYLQLTKFMSYVNEALFLHGMLYVCLIGALRLYTIVYQVLDPFEDWFEEDEDTPVLLIRLIISALVIAYIGFISLISATPTVFYKLTEKDSNLFDVSWKSQLKLGFNITCCVIAITLFTAGKIIQRKKDDAAKVQVSMSSSGNEANGANETSYYVSYVSIMYLSSTSLLFIIIVLVYLGIIYVNIWWGIAMLLAVQGVVMPIVFLALNLTFRDYCWRRFRGDLNNIMIWTKRYERTIKQHNSRVSPLQ